VALITTIAELTNMAVGQSQKGVVDVSAGS